MKKGKAPVVPLSETEMLHILNANKDSSHEGCALAADKRCYGDLLSVPGGKTLCIHHYMHR